MAERLYVSNKNETVRMFDSDFMEFFSRVHPVTPLVLYVPVIGYMLYVSLWQRQLSIVAVVALFLLGVLLWTLTRIPHPPVHIPLRTEDSLGKTVALCDSRRASRLSQRCATACYAASHKHPPRVSFLWSVCSNFWGLAPAVFAGLVFGYVCYDMLHYATHHLAMKRGAWLWLKQYHLRHHFKDDHVGYGISSPLWDYVFRTTRK